MKNKQPVVLGTWNTGHTDSIERFLVKEKETRENIEKLLKENGVPKLIRSYGGDYPIAVSEVGQGYYSNSKKYRVYFVVHYRKVSFIQSDKEGNINIDRLIEKTREIVKEEQRRIDRENLGDIQDNEDRLLMITLNKKLVEKGFEVRKGRLGFEFVKRCEREYLKEVTALLLKI